MGYVKSPDYVEIQTADRWRNFAFDVLGFAQGSGSGAEPLAAM
jgi:hypothetical protein